MPNYCDFTMRVRGRKGDIETFDRYMNAEYYLNDGVLECTEDRCFFRVFETDVCFDLENDPTSEDITATITGYCAWSIAGCFFSNSSYAYYNQYLKDVKDKSTFKGITMDEASKLLNLEIECYSKESGVGFMEYYHIDHGMILSDECYNDYREEETEEGDWIEVGGVDMVFGF